MSGDKPNRPRSKPNDSANQRPATPASNGGPRGGAPGLPDDGTPPAKPKE